MTMRNFTMLIFFWTLVTLIDGFDLRMKTEMGSPTVEECMRPPMSKFGHECCRLPRERIWGNLRKSLNSCFKKMKEEGKPIRQEMLDDGQERMTPESTDIMTPTEVPAESSSPHATNARRPHGKKPLSERLKELFTTVYKEIKGTINSIWQSVVIITDHFRRHTNDSCFMECVFEDQGFLMDKAVNKAAILQRFDETLGKNDVWHKAAVDALEACYQMVVAVPTNKTCDSGSEEIFRCIFKQIFFNCPNWTQSKYVFQMLNKFLEFPELYSSNLQKRLKRFRRNKNAVFAGDYCMSLKNFYQKCPNGPPPEINDSHTTSPAPSEEDIETSSSTESERYTQPE